VQYGEDVDVADWFAGFSTVYEADQVVEEVEDEPSPAKKGRRGKGRGSRKIIQVQENFDKRDSFNGKKCLSGTISMLFDLTFPCYLTILSGKKCLSGKVIFAFFCFAYRSSPIQHKKCKGPLSEVRAPPFGNKEKSDYPDVETTSGVVFTCRILLKARDCLPHFDHIFPKGPDQPDVISICRDRCPAETAKQLSRQTELPSHPSHRSTIRQSSFVNFFYEQA
jgi:hypothetical protein